MIMNDDLNFFDIQCVPHILLPSSFIYFKKKISHIFATWLLQQPNLHIFKLQ